MPKACKSYRPQTKGKVENVVEYKVMFISIEELIHTLKTEKFIQKTQTRIKRIQEANLVIIDDLIFMAMD